MELTIGGLSYSANMQPKIKPEDEKIEMPFSEFLKKSIYDVSDSQMYTQKLTDQLISGDLENLHDLSVASEISSINFLALTEVKNKVIDAYREIMRIQV